MNLIPEINKVIFEFLKHNLSIELYKKLDNNILKARLFLKDPVSNKDILISNDEVEISDEMSLMSWEESEADIGIDER